MLLKSVNQLHASIPSTDEDNFGLLDQWCIVLYWPVVDDELVPKTGASRAPRLVRHVLETWITRVQR